MIGLPPESSRPDTLLPYTTLFRPAGLELGKEKSTNLARSVSDEPHTTLFAPDFNDPYVGGVTRDPQNDADAEAESIAVYAFDTVELSPMWEPTGGLRGVRFAAEATGGDHNLEAPGPVSRSARSGAE